MQRLTVLAALLLVSIPLSWQSVLAASVTAPELKTTEAHYIYENDNLRIQVNKSTGLMDSLVSTLPPEEELLPSDTKGPVIALRREGSDELGLAVLSHPEVKQDGAAYGLSCEITFPGTYQPYMTGTLTYVLKPEMVSIQVRLRYMRDDSARYVIHIYNPFETRKWKKQVFLTWGVYETPEATASTDLLYQPSVGDIKLKEYNYSYYPFGFLIGEDREMFLGSLDLASHFRITNNVPEGSLPSFQNTAAGLEKGGEYALEYTYKVFPQPYPTWLPAARFAAEHMYSSDPLTQGIVTYLPEPAHYPTSPEERARYALARDQQARLLPSGAASGLAYNVLPVGPERDEAEKLMLKAHFTNLWHGEWWAINGAPEQDPEKKENIQRLRTKGFKVYLYFCQALQFPTSEIETWRKWINRAPDGSYMMKSDGDYTVACPDFCDDDFREYYVGQVKKLIAYYDPDGVAWDMHWGPGVETTAGVFSWSKPQSAFWHGQLRAQYEIYRWLRETYPDKRVIVNHPFGLSPTQLVSDATLMEIGIHGFSPQFLELQKIYGRKTYLLMDLPWLRQSGMNTDQLRDVYVKNALYGLGMGIVFGCYGGNFVDTTKYNTYYFCAPFMTDYQDLYDFCFETSKAPVVNNPELMEKLVCVPNSLRSTSTIWLSSDRFLMAVYGWAESGVSANAPVRMVLGKKLVEAIRGILVGHNLTAAPLAFHIRVFGADGFARENDFQCEQSEDTELVFSGTLDKGELLTVSLAGV